MKRRLRKNNIEIKFLCSGELADMKQCPFNERQHGTQACRHFKDYHCTSEMAKFVAVKKKLKQLLEGEDDHDDE